ncbi:hypothetical protein RDWZM_008979 [Blomia tropicalis]|uniref:Enoyl reductase (ER) domain-containing protein n=1 Tax=Blomia tropicalis TaxID=40697 RepID=A0A9Q0M2S9_BLOTA|nr:hypothetical protein RDWZM_008979 [Blomia tropicalis]
MFPLESKLLKVFQLSANFREAVRLTTETIRSISPDEILVKNMYVGVNATDLNVTAGRYFAHDPIPYRLGIESLGQIVMIGSNVTNFGVKQYVVTKPARMRAYSEYLVLNVHDDHVVRIDEPNPNCLTLLGTSGLTSAIGLSESARIMPGETVLITAAAGGLGHLAAQWAMLKGCRVIGLTSTAQKAEYLNGLHLERVINYRTEDLSQVLTAEYPNGIDVIWETVGSPLFEQLFEHLARKGRLVNVGATAGYKTVGYADIKIKDFIVKLHYGARTVIGFLLMDYKQQYKQYADELLDYYNRGLIHPKCQVTDEHNLDGVFNAIDNLHAGLNIGKMMVKLD